MSTNEEQVGFNIEMNKQKIITSTINGDDKKQSHDEHREVKTQLLAAFFREHINLSDEQISSIVGFSIEEVANIRRNCHRSGSMSNEDKPLTWDYVLCFHAGKDTEFRKPTSKELKNRQDNDSQYDNEWTNGITQTKYYAQIYHDIWKRLERAKLGVKGYRSADGTKMFLVCGITEVNLRYWADERDTDLEINAEKAVEDGRKRDFPLAKRTAINTDEDSDSKRYPLSVELWRHLYVQYNPRANSQIYLHYDRVPGQSDISTIFDEKTRLRIIYESIISDSNEGGAEVMIQECITNDNHPLKAVFPLHNKIELDQFENEWIRNYNITELMWCPLDKIRSYFGEPLAFYFAFLAFYLRWLIAPSIIGVIFFVEQMIVGKPDAPGVPIMSFFIIFWAVAFIDFWIREEGYLRLRWGMTKFQQKAVARPEFRGEWTHDAITGLWTEHFSFLQRGIRISSTLFVISIFLAGCIASVISILLLRDRDPSNDVLKIELGIVNGVIIFAFDLIYSKLSYFGNDFENHRTEEDYLNAMITKSFIFKFFNSFASLFYLAFVRPAVDGRFFYLRFYKTSVCVRCHDSNDLRIRQYISTITNQTNTTIYNDIDKDSAYPNSYWKYCYTDFIYNYTNTTSGKTVYQNMPPVCTVNSIRKDMNNAVLNDVRIQLVTLFLTAIVIQNFLEVFIPYVMQKLNDYKRKRQEAQGHAVPKRSEAEEQMELEPFTSTLEDMSELIIQFGYVTLFIIALPLTPLLAYLNNIVEMKIDGINYVMQTQRPNPNGSYGIGAWNNVLAFFSFISVATNVAMMTWSTSIVHNVTGKTSNEYRWIFFSILSIILALLISFEKFIIPDVPDEVSEAMERQRLIENVLVLGANVDGDIDDIPEKDDDDFVFNPALPYPKIEELELIPTSDLVKAPNTASA